jgi:cation diffusion facilitator CzcD-associated flavoprotein CzcO
MNTAEVLASSLAPGSDRVYFLGCFESRVTVYAQQVRALNLVSALVGEGKIRSTGKIAIIGGGAAGMAAAAAVVALRPDLQKLVLFERKPDLLHMQMQSRDRYLHPHIYDWPRNGSLQSNAGLPLLDWEADSADVVAKTLEHRFRSFQEAPCVEVRTSTSVAGISILGSGCRVGLENGGVDQTVFDAAILSVGFGYTFTRPRSTSRMM